MTDSFSRDLGLRVPTWLLDRSLGSAFPLTEHLETTAVRTLVVVPTLNEASHIEGVLSSLVRNVERLSMAVIAVVDGGSSDATCSIVRAMMRECDRILLLRNGKRIQSAAINLAAQTLGQNAQVLIRCDAHAGYSDNFCHSVLDTMIRKEADSVVVPMVSEGTTRLQRAVAWVSNSRIGTGGSSHRGDSAQSGFVDHGHHAGIRIDMLRLVGGYDETFTHNEDAELDCRQTALGGKIYLDTANPIKYMPRTSPAALCKQYFAYGAGRSRTVRRHPGSWRIRQMAVVANTVLLLLAIPLTAVTPLAFVWPALYGSALVLASLKIVAQKRSATGLLAAPLAAIMHNAWAIGFVVQLLRKREARWSPELVAPLWHAKSEPGPDGSRLSGTSFRPTAVESDRSFSHGLESHVKRSTRPAS